MASKKEIAAIAAKWWSDLVDAGGTDFENILANEIEIYLAQKHWDEHSPQTGEALRVIYVEYSPCMVLTGAAVQVGISVNSFPWKTVMWLNPNGIKVRSGEGALVQEISVT